MPDEETTQAEQPAEAPKEEVFELQGAGFIPNRPGIYANCRVVFWTENGELKSRVEPLEAAIVVKLVTPAEQSTSEPVTPAQPGAQSTEQPTQQESNGG